AKPWDDNAIILTVRDALERKRLEAENGRLAALTQRQNEELKELNAGLERKVAERTAELQQTVAFLDQAHRDLKRGFLDAVRVFSGLIELRAGKLAGHSRRVAEHARSLGQRLGLDEAAIQTLLLAALLHDIGKIGLPDALIDKPFNNLSAEGRVEVAKHPETGAMLLMGIEQLKPVVPLVRHHHECFDGSGFPDKLTGLAIPMGARILAVANEYDALQMGTLVARPLKSSEALAFLVDNRGKRYDPAVVDVFAAMIAETLKSEIVEVPMRPAALRPGMALTRDLLHKDGYLLLAKGQVLDGAVIEQLVKLETSDGQPLTIHIRQEK
ncbi:MAG TPA: HD domain-containing phosphohydrolase, partial [Rhodocyclaceae bacterium]|nr:HD domain-containing phosphohydrolase [Rhodocyclaceae bacterium]